MKRTYVNECMYVCIKWKDKIHYIVNYAKCIHEKLNNILL